MKILSIFLLDIKNKPFHFYICLVLFISAFTNSWFDFNIIYLKAIHCKLIYLIASYNFTSGGITSHWLGKRWICWIVPRSFVVVVCTNALCQQSTSLFSFFFIVRASLSRSLTWWNMTKIFRRNSFDNMILILNYSCFNGSYGSLQRTEF